MGRTSIVYNVIYVALIVFLSTHLLCRRGVQPYGRQSDESGKYGGYIPGIQAGKATADYLDKVLSRLNLAGAVYLSAVCVLPQMLTSWANVPFYFGGTSLRSRRAPPDTMSQIESHPSYRDNTKAC